MAVPSLVCRSRLLFRTEITRVLHYSILINTSSFNKCAQLRRWRQCRKLSSLGSSSDGAKEKSNKDIHNIVSEDELDDVDREDVTISYYRGLPQVTVPLPSRKERCRFTLRPISNTVGDFLEMLKLEDKGIDRVAAMTEDGTRIASSNTVETLLEDNFKLIVNDNTYFVRTPKQEKLSIEEITRLSDVRNLINQLYEALNVQEHQLKKERQLNTELESLKQAIAPLEETRESLERVAVRKGNIMAWAGLGLMSVQFGILARLTWWEYSWDIMEPVTYFVTYGTAMAAYAYFVLTKEEYILADVRDRQHLLTLHKRAKKNGLDIVKYNQLKDQISKVELELRRLRDPLHIHLPPNVTAKYDKQITFNKDNVFCPSTISQDSRKDGKC